MHRILSDEKIKFLLSSSHIGSFATINADGAPYITPVHFVYEDGKIYIHGLPKGQKIDNILRGGKVGFSVYQAGEYIRDPDGKPCNTNTEYQSVIVTGNAVLIDDIGLKASVLQKIVRKYTPELFGAELPEPRVRGTAVIEVTVSEITGKYYN